MGSRLVRFAATAALAIAASAALGQGAGGTAGVAVPGTGNVGRNPLRRATRTGTTAGVIPGAMGGGGTGRPITAGSTGTAPPGLPTCLSPRRSRTCNRRTAPTTIRTTAIPIIIRTAGDTAAGASASAGAAVGVATAAVTAETTGLRLGRIPQTRKIRPNPFGAGSGGRARGDRRSAFLLWIGAAWHADRGKRHDAKVKVEQPS